MNKSLQNIFLLLAISVFSYTAKAQRDLITTNAGEEIRCKILDETPTRFIYAYLGPKNKVLRNEIFKNLVSSFKYSHYSENILKNDKLNNNKRSSGGPRIDTRKSSNSKPSRKSRRRKGKSEEASIKIENKSPEAPKEVAKEVAKVEVKPEIIKKVAETPKSTVDSAKAVGQSTVSPIKKEEVKSAVPEAKASTDKSTTNIPVDVKEDLKLAEKKAEDIKKSEAKSNKAIKDPIAKVEPKLADKKVEDTKKPALNSNKVIKEPVAIAEPKLADKKVEEAKIDTKKDINELTPKEELKLADKKIEEVKAPDANSNKVDTEEKIKAAKREAEEKEEAKKLEELLAKAKTKEEAKSPFAEPEPISEFKNYLKFRVGVKGGLGNIIQKSTDTSPYGLYKEKLLRGWMFGADAAYFINDKIGLGVMYNNYQASNSNQKLDYLDFISGETVKDGSLSNKVSHKFIGPTLLYRKAIDFKTFAVISLSPGMHLYTDKGEANLSTYKHTGKAYGASATLGLDFLLGNDIYGRDIILSLEGGYNYGQITSLNYGGSLGTQTLANPINLNRLDFSIGLRFTRFPVYLR